MISLTHCQDTPRGTGEQRKAMPSRRPGASSGVVPVFVELQSDNKRRSPPVTRSTPNSPDQPNHALCALSITQHPHGAEYQDDGDEDHGRCQRPAGCGEAREPHRGVLTGCLRRCLARARCGCQPRELRHTRQTGRCDGGWGRWHPQLSHAPAGGQCRHSLKRGHVGGRR